MGAPFASHRLARAHGDVRGSDVPAGRGAGRARSL